MPFGVNLRNILIMMAMAVVGFYATSFLVEKYGKNP